MKFKPKKTVWDVISYELITRLSALSFCIAASAPAAEDGDGGCVFPRGRFHHRLHLRDVRDQTGRVRHEGNEIQGGL